MTLIIELMLQHFHPWSSILLYAVINRLFESIKTCLCWSGSSPLIIAAWLMSDLLNCEIDARRGEQSQNNLETYPTTKAFDTETLFTMQIRLRDTISPHVNGYVETRASFQLLCGLAWFFSSPLFETTHSMMIAFYGVQSISSGRVVKRPMGVHCLNCRNRIKSNIFKIVVRLLSK